MQKFNLSPRATSLLNASAAFVLYGGWAIYANFEHGQKAGLIAGAVQGVYAFVSTLSVTLVALNIYQRSHGGKLGIIAGFSVGFLVMLIIPWVVHSAAGTPNKLQTVLPGIIWGSLYLGAVLTLHAKNTSAPPH